MRRGIVFAEPVRISGAEMKRTLKYLGMILLLHLPVAATAQVRYSDPANRHRAKEIGTSMLEAIRAKEQKKWKLKVALVSEFGFHPYLKSGSQELDLSIFVYDSPEEASRNLELYSGWSSLTASSRLKDFGDEAYYIQHRYFTWIAVRKGRMLVGVHRTGPELTITRRIAEYGLEQLVEK